MTDLVEIVHEAGEWDLSALHKLAEDAARCTLEHVGLSHEGYEIALLACDDARIAALNAQFRSKSHPTNVLSWPAWDLSAETAGNAPELPPEGDMEDPESLGNIALAFETCAREAAEQGKPFSAHLTHLVVHSVLHLLGYDHIRDKDAALMEETEITILASMGVTNPYELGAEMPL
ncbi:MAG: putative rRNA maturation factor YbeY [Roseibaca calidilacus]|uniref:Endoribonuclease YbeY n=1 Tax=Roseibaca calidilacus TaxID=1666912 RepID=A0A0P7W4R8_9RHOB|nr:MAG: putative rRNA maturation factor YbeY [Roseibaca calidilacus]CUX82756.1 probable rRNA maturation factor [Roseibaca calidilacus]